MLNNTRNNQIDKKELAVALFGFKEDEIKDDNLLSTQEIKDKVINRIKNEIATMYHRTKNILTSVAKNKYEYRDENITDQDIDNIEIVYSYIIKIIEDKVQQSLFANEKEYYDLAKHILDIINHFVFIVHSSTKYENHIVYDSFIFNLSKNKDKFEELKRMVDIATKSINFGLAGSIAANPCPVQ